MASSIEETETLLALSTSKEFGQRGLLTILVDEVQGVCSSLKAFFMDGINITMEKVREIEDNFDSNLLTGVIDAIFQTNSI